MLAAVLGVLLCLLGCSPSGPAEQTLAFKRATNVGVAQLENKSSAQAVEAFERARELAPDSPLALRNLARAYLLARDTAKVEKSLARARDLDPESAATQYLSGIALARDSRFEEAALHLEAALRLDPHTAALSFQLARAYQALGRHEEATRQLQQTIELDPLHTAAHYRLVGYARRAGDRAALEQRQRELLRLRSLLGEENRSPEALERCVYTQAELAPTSTAASSRPTQQVRFSDASNILPANARRAKSAALLALDARGRYTLVLTGHDGRLSLLAADATGNLVERAIDALVPASFLSMRPLSMLVANFHDTIPPATRYDPAKHARNDVLILSPAGALLLEQLPGGSFEDVTASAGLEGLRGNAARWLDYDHDGDVDLAVAAMSSTQLWQNDGDGHFQEVSASVGIFSTGAVSDLAAVDLDNDVAIDLVLARGAAPTLLLKNQRTGHFARQPEPPGPWPAARRVLIDDLDDDGLLDTALVQRGEVVILSGRGGARRRLEFGSLEPEAAGFIDYDNDGRLDLLVAGEQREGGKGSRLRLWRNRGGLDWAPSAALEGFEESAAIRELLAADLDGDGDSDLLLTTDAGLRLLRNEGGHQGGQLKLRLVGLKTNPAGIGSRVEVRAAGFRAHRSLQTPFAEVGLAEHRQLDSIQTLWTNGIVDNLIDVAATDTPLAIAEKNVAAGSCPFLYAWDGEGFRFVTDLLGNSPLGLSLRRGVALAADPDELVYIGGPEQLAPREGQYLLQISEELREVLYLDHARLLAVDHPADVEVHPSDRLMPPPFPPSELWALREPRAPRRALGSDGIDRTAALQKIDGVFTAPGPPRPPPLRGQTEELVLTLDFGGFDSLEHPVLALTGWLQYGDASTNIAMSQNESLPVVPTQLEMEGVDGVWRAIDVTVGMPAGKTKTIVVDLLGKLLPETRRLRLRTTFELRWDRIALLERLPASALRIHQALPDEAELRYRGYSEIRSRAPHHPTTPAHALLLAHPPWRTTPQGWVTRLGDVRELVTRRDSRLVIMNGGDALELRFGARFPEPPAGQRRSFFLYSVGWDKDADHNVIDGDRVEPLPVVSADTSEGLAHYDTRWISRDQVVR